MYSYLLVVSGVNPRWGDQIESDVVVRPCPAPTAQPHQKSGDTGYENHPTSFYPARTRAQSWSCITSERGVALKRRQDTPELVYGLRSHRARCGEAVVNW
ncbi:hypothetical protein N7495_009839 [Penicillium taxi]|uniref:uncharacterized protein n=1 Tax=Penicillium taxi TaxID=168475 RepID=UPI0025455797|nr:uncharacterized protein N7495_009839 [Penicillium taxi]KAJ5885329.1 hypothetical protein N7495_009839 [Penicillium taxi]